MRTVWIPLLLACLGACATSPAAAAIFTVDTLLDGPQEHDTNTGDGLCITSRSQCSLRAAIEQANALAGPHEIRFAISGTISPAVEGALPGLTRPTAIRGETAPGYASGAGDLGDAVPRLWLDGTFAPDGTSGLTLHTAGSSIQALGIVAMPGHGIAIGAAAAGVSIRDCWIGVRSDGSAAGNGEDGIRVSGADARIGKSIQGNAAVGRGNVISANRVGVRLMTPANHAHVHGNRIGLSADGTAARGNLSHGVVVESNFARIGAVLPGHDLGNLIAANGGHGISIQAGSAQRVQANVLGRAFGGAVIPGPMTGITVSGAVSDLQIGGTGPNEGNAIANHQVGMVVGGSSAGPVRVSVLNNTIGGIGDLGTRGDGLRVGECESCEIIGNHIPSTGGTGLEMSGSGILAYDNTIGYQETAFGPVSSGIDGCGILVLGDANTLGPPTSAVEGAPVGNRIGYAASGICVEGHGNVIRQAVIGVTAGGVAVPNREDGIRLGASVRGNTVEDSILAHNQRHGIAVEGGGNAAENLFTRNLIAANLGQAIDLGEDGVDSNDAGDADEGGPHRRINHPLLSGAQWFIQAGRPHLRVSVRHDAPADRVDYPLYIGLHLNADASREAQRPLLVRALDAAGQVLVVEAELPAGTRGGYLTALASGLVTGSSELSPPLVFGDPQGLFFNGFE